MTVRVAGELRPGDVGRIVELHGTLYASEWGYDSTFEAYVAEPLARFVRTRTPRERLWLVEEGASLVGCLAIVRVSDEEAQLRWVLLHPSLRGRGLGRRLLAEAIGFCRDSAYRRVVLWSVSHLPAAAHLYADCGFRVVEEKPGRMGGKAVTEQRWLLDLEEAREAAGAAEIEGWRALRALRARVEEFRLQLEQVPEAATTVKLSADRWTLREIVGHLIDSASNNHQRFVRLQRTRVLDFPAYEGEAWVELQKYNGVDWRTLKDLWYRYNRLLLHLVQTLDPAAAANVWRVEGRELRLDWLVQDYYRHLAEHGEHFQRRLGEVQAAGSQAP